MTPELKPCPFCGSSELSSSSQDFDFECVICECGCEGPPDKLSESVSAWNRRASLWQPIETAPLDRSKIVVAAFWNGDWHYGLSWWIPFAGRFEYITVGNEAIDPTHWQPIEPPKGTEK